jgi:hypothetical protein
MKNNFGFDKFIPIIFLYLALWFLSIYKDNIIEKGIFWD